MFVSLSVLFSLTFLACEAEPQACALMLDGDGHGDPSGERFCVEEGTPEAGNYTTQGGDCDDADPEVHPDATEVCGDALDNDCDGLVDDADPERDPSLGQSYFVDADGDGYGDPDMQAMSCQLAEGLVENDQDCDDTQAAVSPVGVEVCDAVDNDCDGLVDDLDLNLDIRFGVALGDSGVALEAVSSLLVAAVCDMDGGSGGRSDVVQLSTGESYDCGSGANFTCLSGLCC